MKDQAAPLRANSLWKEMYSLAEYMYGTLEGVIAKFPDERYITVNRIRSATNESMFYLSEAVGSSLPYTNEFEWNMARKNLFAVQTEYMLADKLNFLKADPKIVKRIDSLLEEIGRQVDISKKASKEHDREDLEPWLEKYRLWREINTK